VSRGLESSGPSDPNVHPLVCVCVCVSYGVLDPVQPRGETSETSLNGKPHPPERRARRRCEIVSVSLVQFSSVLVWVLPPHSPFAVPRSVNRDKLLHDTRTMPFGGQFEDAELERQFQEEIRRRQQHQHQHQQQLNSYHHGLMMPGASDPYYAASRPQYPPGYGIAAESGYDPNSKSAATAAIAHYYAAEQQRRQATAAALQQQQQAPHHPGYAGYRHGMADPRWMAAANSYGSPSPYGREAAAAYLQQEPPRAAPPKPQGASSAKPAATHSSTAKASPPSKHLSIEEQAAAVGEEEEEGDTHPPMKTTLTKSGKPRKQRSPRVKELQELRTIMKKSVLHQHRQQGNEILDENGERKWFTGCVPLGLPDDKYWLSELQGYLRHNFAEAFGATEEDIAAPMHGRNKPIALGQVGIRCMHCKDDNPAERGQQSTSYPSQISGIYNSVQQMLRLHYDCCLSMPTHVRQRIESLRITCSSRGGRKQYWIESAKRLGLVDTPHGIHFIRDPSGPVPPLTDVRACMDKPRKKKAIAPTPEAEESKKEEEEDGGSDAEQKPPALVKKRAASPLILERPPQPPPDARPLVFPNDKPLISDYLYLTLEQMAPCNLMEADRVGCYKNRDINFPGLACRHCVGQAGSGRYFPASEASLSQTTTSQTIMNHVRNCRRCPIEIRENLEIMKRNRMGPDGKRADKPKHGGRKVFFHRLWCRIQNVPFEEGKGERRETKSPKKQPKKSSKSGKKKKAKGGRRKSSKFSDDSNTDTEEDTDTEDDEEQEDSEEDSKPKARERSGSRSTPVLARRKVSPWFEGCVRLAKDDDFHWIVDMECHVRKEFVEVFSLKKNDRLDGYTGRKEPATGQVGIRCVFCANAGTGVRSNGCIAFPDMLSSIHTKVKDMIRLHFPNCPNMPEKQRRTWKTMKDYDAQGVANDDAAQYWVDAARDLGLANIPPAGIGARKFQRVIVYIISVWTSSSDTV
jgi:hypothetical protein